MADKQRLRILGLVSKGPLVVNDIKTVLHLSMSTVSQHLSILREADLLLDNKQGRWVFYSINPKLIEGTHFGTPIYNELKKFFAVEETFKYDREILDKINRPAVTLKKENIHPALREESDQ